MEIDCALVILITEPPDNIDVNRNIPNKCLNAGVNDSIIFIVKKFGVNVRYFFYNYTHPIIVFKEQQTTYAIFKLSHQDYAK